MSGQSIEISQGIWHDSFDFGDQVL
jgi:hypothetical protein